VTSFCLVDGRSIFQPSFSIATRPRQHFHPHLERHRNYILPASPVTSTFSPCSSQPELCQPCQKFSRRRVKPLAVASPSPVNRVCFSPPTGVPALARPRPTTSKLHLTPFGLHDMETHPRPSLKKKYLSLSNPTPFVASLEG